MNGADEAWPAWYAQWLAPRLAPYLTVSMPALAEALRELDAEHRRTAGAGPWPEFYAERLVKRFG